MKTILLAEDDSFIRDIYGSQLKKAGYKVDIAIDGQMALDKISKGQPDLVVLDLGLPKVDGWEVLRALRTNAATKKLKVIVISNVNPQDYPSNASELGVLKFFLKVESPIDEIVSFIQEILK
jgi:DNA-binding response OmpR family regulator